MNPTPVLTALCSPTRAALLTGRNHHMNIPSDTFAIR
jgi:arylsulfatase A-like enzyme